MIIPTNTNIFEKLLAIDITDKIKEKNKMKYLPWSSAWEYMKSVDPMAKYNVVKSENGCLYHTDGKTCWVETIVYAGGLEQGESLPVMDNRNQAISLENITTTSVNKAIKRCLVKNCALFGLGLNLWYGEELSENAKRERVKKLSVLDELKAKAITLCKNVTSNGVDSKVLSNMLKEKYGEGNPNKIDDIEILKVMVEHLEKMEGAT